jgi:MOSC domain-containing protein YiiM
MTARTDHQPSLFADDERRIARLVSIQAGRSRELPPAGDGGALARPCTTAFDKRTVSGAVRVDENGVEGDEHADRRYSGGADQAVLLYAAAHYARWRAELARPDLPHGGFAENLTVAGVDERTACVGDVWSLGDVRLALTHPRTPCWKIARRWEDESLPARAIATGRTGWYARVLFGGSIEPGMTLELLSRPEPRWTMAHATAVMKSVERHGEDARRMAGSPLLGTRWRERLEKRLG